MATTESSATPISYCESEGDSVAVYCLACLDENPAHYIIINDAEVLCLVCDEEWRQNSEADAR